MIFFCFHSEFVILSDFVLGPNVDEFICIQSFYNKCPGVYSLDNYAGDHYNANR